MLDKEKRDDLRGLLYWNYHTVVGRDKATRIWAGTKETWEKLGEDDQKWLSGRQDDGTWLVPEKRGSGTDQPDLS